MIGTGGTAFATLGTITTQIDPTNGATTVYPGGSGVAVGDFDINLTNGFNIGDTIAVDLGGGDCTVSNKAVGFSGTPTVTANGPFTNPFNSPAGLATDSSFVLPTFTVKTQSNGAGCSTAGVNDELLITFTNSSAGLPGDNIQLTVSGQKVNVGSALTAPTNITENANSTGAVTVATVSYFKTSITAVGAAPSATAVGLNPISVTDVPGGQITTNIVFTLAGTSQFKAAGTLSTPSGVTATGPSETLPSSVLTYTLTGTTPANGTYTLSGATANLDATVGDIAVSVTSNGGAVGSGNAVVTATATRKSGDDRYATAAALFPATTTAVLVSGESYPDALSANFLAGQAGAGILLTDPNTLSTAAANAIKTNNVTKVYIVGGTAAVSQAVEDALTATHVGGNSAQPLITVVRVAGADRYDTNRAVVLYTVAQFGVSPATAFVATGQNFADALSVGPAVANGIPLILTTGGSLSSAAQNTLTQLALSKGLANAIIVGGTAAVSANVATQIAGNGVAVQSRLSGDDRTGTAAAIAKWEVTNLGFTKATVNLARGDNFPDALAAGVFAGNLGQVILLTQSPSALGAGAPTFLKGNGGVTTAFTVLGGTSAVSAATVSAAIAALG